MVEWTPPSYYNSGDNIPYITEDLGCWEEAWIGTCCEWLVDDYYQECIETWCYDAEWDDWQYYGAAECLAI